MSTVNYLEKMVFVDPTSTTGTSIGDVQTIFKGMEMRPFESTKGAKRDSIAFRNKADGKLTFAVMSEKMTEVNRLGYLKGKEDEVAGFPVFYSETLGPNKDQAGFFIGLPTAGFVDVDTLVKKDYVPMRLNVKDLMNASIGGN